MKRDFEIRKSGAVMIQAKRLMLILLAVLVLSFTVTGYTYAAADPDITVTYSDNGATGGKVPVGATQYASGAEVTVSGNTGNLVKTDYTFGGWMAGTTIYQPGNSIVISQDITLKAVWIPVYTVTYDGNQNGNGTVPVDSSSYTDGAQVTVLGNTGYLSKEAESFVGWNTETDGTGTQYLPGATFSMGTENMILHAQ